MSRILVALFSLVLSTAIALAQSSGTPVLQAGSSITPGSIPYWVANGVIGGGVTASDSPVSSFGATGQICSLSDRVSSGAWQALCLQASTSSAGTISLQNYGAAPAEGLNFVINGTTVSIPTGAGTIITGNSPFTVADVPCFSSTTGTVKDCGLALSAGTVTGGTWQGTAVAIGYGGTGASTAAAARTNLGLGTMATQNASSVVITGGTITGMPTPVAASDVAIKSYVDATATGLNILPQSALATAAVLPNSPTYSNGTSGVGATLTAGTNTTLTVDGTAAPLNTVVLVKNQASAFQNGIYTVTTAGSGSAPWVLTRATYFDQASEMKTGSYTFITSGSTNTNSSWVLQASVTTVGTDSLTFNQFSSATNVVLSLGGQTGNITLGNGLLMSGSTLSNNIAAGAGVTISGSSLLTISAGLTSTAAVSGASTTYTSTQSGELVLRSNSGAAMVDTIPGTSPGVLPAGTYAIKNNDTAGVLAIKAGSGATLHAVTAPTGYIYICPGQTFSFYSDGSNYWALSQPSACFLTAATTFYGVASGGSATNTGLTSASPLDSCTDTYALVQASFDASLLDPSSQPITIQCGTPSTPGQTFGATVITNRIPGQGDTNTQDGVFPVIIQGDTTTPTNIAINAINNPFGAFQVFGDASLLVQGFSLSTSGNGDDLYDNRAWVAYKSMDFGSSAVNQIAGTHQAHIEIAGSYTWTGSMGCHWLMSDGASIFNESASTVITATSRVSAPSMTNAFACAQYPSSIVMDFKPTFAGVNVQSGFKCEAFLNGISNSNGVSYPGSGNDQQSGGQCG